MLKKLVFVMIPVAMLGACGDDPGQLQQNHHRHRKWMSRETEAGYHDAAKMPAPPKGPTVASPTPQQSGVTQ